MRLLVPVFHYRCRQNGVEGVRYMSPSEVRSREPYVTDDQHGAFFFPTTGQLSPYQLTLAYAENAVSNGAEIFLRTGVSGFEMERSPRGGERIARVQTNRGTLLAGIVVNAAGTWSDVVADLAGDRFFSIHGRKGVDALLDITTGRYQSTVMALIRFAHLTSKTKGGGVVPTVEGNLLVGPTAAETPYREDYSTSAEDIEDLLTRFGVNKMIGKSDIITYFAGVRACTYEEDFVIEPSTRVENLIHAAGIQSPGIASAPAIAEDVAEMCRESAERFVKEVQPNPRFDPVRKGPVRLKQMRDEERAALIRRNPSYGRIVCRCEEISEGEIRDALRAPLPVNTLDGIKRRTRGGMGRCQGGFCTPRVMEIYREETGLELTEITKKGLGSRILYRSTKGRKDTEEEV
jgi:glycerol-3-phosphate dehydrogenase